MPAPRSHGHVTPNPGGIVRCGGPVFCTECQAELATLGITLEEWTAAWRVGIARVLAALVRVVRRDYSPEDKLVILAELLGERKAT